MCITLLNSYSGWTLCLEGFMLDNTLLTTVGSLIGCSGAILSVIMCDAMNRSISNVIFGGMQSAKGDLRAIEGEVQTCDVDAVADAMVEGKKICFVPGYGLAVSNGE